MTMTDGSAPAGTPPASEPAAADWTASLTPELKGVVEAKGYKSPADVVQAYANAERLIGADKIPVPKDGVWDAAARAKLGIPDTPDKYAFEKPQLPEGMEWDDGFQKAALAKAHELGLTPAQVNGLMGLYAGTRGNEFAAMQQATVQQREEAAAALKQEWGNAYSIKVDAAGRAARSIGGDALIEALEKSGAGNNPEIIRAFAKIGAMMGEDKLRVGQAAGFGMTPAEARVEANKLMASEAYRNRTHVEHGEVVKKVAALFAEAYPES